MRFLALLFVLLSPLFAPPLTVAPANPSSEVPAQYRPFLGQWTGVLEYRDFQSDARVQLPTWLEVSFDPDTQSLLFLYIYDDGPSKIVKELSRVTIDSKLSVFTVTSDRDKSSDSYRVSRSKGFAGGSGGELELVGKGMENDREVEVHILIKVSRNSCTYSKETRLPGAAFLFRDGYTFTRRNPPQPAS